MKKKNKNIIQKSGSLLIILILVCFGFLFIIPINLEFETAIATSSWVQTLKTDFKNGTLNNLTILGTGEDAELRIDLSEQQLWTNMTPTNKPGPRYFHDMTSIYGDDKVLLFGGLDPREKDETWVYDLSNNAWNFKLLMNRPRARYNPDMANVFGDDKVVLFGGCYRSGMTMIDLNDTWIYDLSNNTWTEYFPTNTPSPRNHHKMAPLYGTNKVLLFGGMSYSYPFSNNETWIYDLSNNTWTHRTPINPPTAGGHDAMASIYGDDKVILFDGVYFDGGIWVYDYSENTWTLKTQTTKPSPRRDYAISSIYGTDKVMLYGGWYSNVSGDFNYWDTWVYDLSDNTWIERTPINLMNKPNSSSYHIMASIYGTDKVLLFGGRNTSWLDETWLYRHFLYTKNGTFLSAPYDTGVNSSFKTISWIGTIPANSSMKFQLRTAANEIDLSTKAFVGPEGKTSKYYLSSPMDIWTGHNGDRWVQIKIYFNIDIVTNSPILKDVTISYNCLPTIIIISPFTGSLLTNNKPVFTWTFNDHESEQQKAFQLLIDDDINFKNIDYDTGKQITTEQHWEFPIGTNFTELPDGTWYWKVRSMDLDSAWTEYSSSRMLTIDIHAPYSAPNIPSNNGFYNKINSISGLGTDSKNGSGVNRIEIAIRRLRDNNYWDGFDWAPLPSWLLTSGTSKWSYDSSAVKWDSSTKYSVQSRAIDNATNIESPSISNVFLIDMESPSSRIDIPMNNIWLNDLDHITGSSLDKGGSGIDIIEISITRARDYMYWDGTSWGLDECWLLAIGKYQWYYNIRNNPWSTGYQYVINSRAIDNASNLEVPGMSKTFKYDDQPPELLSIDINNGDKYTTSTDVILSLSSKDIDSGLSQMSFSIDGYEWSDWEPFNHTRAFNLPEGDSEKSVYFRTRDNASNIAELVFDNIFLDTTPPENLSIIINEGAMYTTSNRVKLSLHAIDKLSGLTDMSLNFDAANWLSWEPFISSRYITLPGDDGGKIIYFKVRDRTGNIAEPISNSVILDTKPPHSLSILINNDELETNSTMVTLKINAIDDTSGISHLSFSSDGENWSFWEYYVEAKSYELSSGDGKKTIYFRVKDRAGNIAESESATIFLNTKPSGEKTRSSKLSLFSPGFWILLIIIIILTFIMSFLVMKRKKYIEQKLLSAGALALDQKALSTSEKPVDLIPGLPPSQQLPGSIVTSDVSQPVTSIPSVPKLAKSTQVVQQPAPQRSSEVAQLPQLPPANIQETTTQNEETLPKSMVSITPGVPESKQNPSSLSETSMPSPQTVTLETKTGTIQSKSIDE